MKFQIKNQATARFWAYATSFGAAWGVWELTLGTFLHMLKLPFAGPILAAASGALLIAERQLIPMRGISIATGLIAATCKSISPDGTILGPMIGILSESLVVEIVFLLLPRGITAPFAGALVSICPLIQKLLTQWLFYGGTLFSLYAAILKKATFNLSLTDAVLILTFILATIGIVFGLLGQWLGRRAVQELYRSLAPENPLEYIKTILYQRESAQLISKDQITEKEQLINKEQIREAGQAFKKKSALKKEQTLANELILKKDQIIKEDQKPIIQRNSKKLFSSVLFISKNKVFILLLSILIQFFHFKNQILAPLIALVIIQTTLIFIDPQVLLKVWRPKFWLLSVPIALLAGLFLGVKDISLGFGTSNFMQLSSTGLIAGAWMLLRAGWILSVTSWISMSLDRNSVYSWFTRMGYSHFGNSISSAFGIMEELRPYIGVSVGQVVSFFSMAAKLAELSALKNRSVEGPIILANVGSVDLVHVTKNKTNVKDAINNKISTFLFAGDQYHSEQIIFLDQWGLQESKGKGKLPEFVESISDKIYIIEVKADYAPEIANQLGGFVPLVSSSFQIF